MMNEKENTKGLAVSTNSPLCVFPLASQADSMGGNRELSLGRKSGKEHKECKRNVNQKTYAEL